MKAFTLLFTIIVTITEGYFVYAANLESSKISRQALVNGKSDKPSTICLEDVVLMAGACQCHLTNIYAIQVLKKISFEGWIQSCTGKYGPPSGWETECLELIDAETFQLDRAVKAVQEVFTNCPGSLCAFYVV